MPKQANRKDFRLSGLKDPLIGEAVINLGKEKIPLSDLSVQAIQNLIDYCNEHDIGVMEAINRAIKEACNFERTKKL